MTHDTWHMTHDTWHMKSDMWANILWLTDTFAYLFGFPGEYYKVTVIIYSIKVLPFVGLKLSKFGNFQTI